MRSWAVGAALILCADLAAAPPTYARHAMVAAQESHATDAGVAVLKAGGNAVDAAVAVGFALAVTHPVAGNIGGGGFMLVRMADGRSTFIDFRERAPSHASHDMYLDAAGKPTDDSLAGYRASGVPGSVRGFEYAHKKFGRASWKDVVQPAITLAIDGVPVSYGMALMFREDAKLLAQFPESKRIFLSSKPGDKLVQPELARTLTRIRDQGARDFYEGETAHLIADAMRAHGGIITLDDLKQYAVVERAPLKGRYRDYEILTAPPPSSGGIGILQMLGMLAGSGYEKSGAASAATIHYVAEVMRRFYADRSEYIADSDFVHVPIATLLNARYLNSRRASIDLQHATSSDAVGPGKFDPAHESLETTHYNVVDAEGNAVAVTYTLNGGFGSGVTVPGAGFLLNNEMDDFSAKPGTPNMFGLVQGEANAIEPGKRPLSSMTPTILLRDGKLYMVLGAPGGGRIINGVLQVLLNVVDFGMNAQQAIDAPRFHHQWRPDKLYLERGISPGTAELLKARGHIVEYDGSVARVEAIRVLQGRLEGGSDGRGYDGKAGGF